MSESPREAGDDGRGRRSGGWIVGCAVGAQRIELVACSADGERHETVLTGSGEVAAATLATLAALDAALARWSIVGAQVDELRIALPLVDEILARIEDEPVAVITPRGCGDLPALGRQYRSDLYAAQPKPDTPLALFPPAWRFELAGRIDAGGHEVEAIDDAEIDALAPRLAALGARSVAVCSLFAHLNPAHERRIGARLGLQLPALAISLSHEVDPQPREFERFLATVLDARVRPEVQRAAQALAEGAAGRGLPAPRMLCADASLASLDDWTRRPMRGACAGPAALLLAARAGLASSSSDAPGAAAAPNAIVLAVDEDRAVAGVLRGGEIARAEGPVVAGQRLRQSAVALVAVPLESPGRPVETLRDLAAAQGLRAEDARLVIIGTGADAFAARLAPRLGIRSVHVARADTAFAAWGLLAATPDRTGSDTPALARVAVPGADATAPHDADALAHELQGSADRMQALLMTSARSSIAREAGDCAAALFLPDGRLLAQARSLPLLLGSLIPAVRAVLERFPVGTMRHGDGFLLNDPWAGGSHLPDLTLVVPILDDGAVVALTASSLHHQDVGGIAPGSVPPNATSIFDEGLRVPPLHSHRGGALDPTLRALLRANTRTPDHLEADLQAQWQAAQLAARELARPLQRLGDAFAPACEALLARAEAMTRAALAAAPDGHWTWHDQLDDDGIEGRPVPLQVSLDKRGDRLTIDFAGTSAQTRGPANASPAAMMSAALYFMRTLAPEAPNNAGCLAPLTLRLPEGSLVNPRWPAAVNARTATVKLACNALLGAWGREAAAVTMAAHAGVAVVMALGGERADGQAFFFTEIVASGAGASAAGPGASGLSTDVGNARNTPIEVIESLAPVRVEAYELRRGSGGAGRHPGGDGVRRVYRLLEGHARLSYRGERHTSRAPGCAGGEPGASSRALVIRAEGREEALPPRAQVELRAGDRWIVETAGGGGWGTPDKWGIA